MRYPVDKRLVQQLAMKDWLGQQGLKGAQGWKDPGFEMKPPSMPVQPLPRPSPGNLQPMIPGAGVKPPSVMPFKPSFPGMYGPEGAKPSAPKSTRGFGPFMSGRNMPPVQDTDGAGWSNMGPLQLPKGLEASQELDALAEKLKFMFGMKRGG